MKSIKLILTATLLILICACSDKDEKQQCNCKADAEPTEVINKTATVTWDATVGMYLLSEYTEDEQLIDGGPQDI